MTKNNRVPSFLVHCLLIASFFAIASCTAPRPKKPYTIPPINVASAAPESYAWPNATASNAITDLNQEINFSQSAASRIQLPLRKIETKYFILFTNVPEDQSIDFLSDLDQMYTNVIELLNMPPQLNIWKGKAAVYLFNTREQFIRFEKNMYNNTITFQAAICHQHYSGEVRIATYNMKDKEYLHQLMVHEAAHGIIHRYRSPHRIPTWLNEGLAEWAAMSTQQDQSYYTFKKRLSAKFIANKEHFPKTFFGPSDFIPEYYGTALAITDMLIAQGKTDFIRFIDHIKSGKSWQNALNTTYGMTPSALVAAYGNTIDLTSLTIKAE
ncbi:hypothetical protein [Poriferisphaera sp. WC338]|uniref:hypothetical protein n=1 Tax=Poriferisphaera sp. WC338 TaxID=3425129 RepID=UPI003D817885